MISKLGYLVCMMKESSNAMSSPYTNKPEPFFRGHPHLVVVEEDDCVGLNVGYEALEWRYEAFADYLFEWLVEFTTSFSDLRKLNPTNCLRMIRRAANIVYSTDKYDRRGEFGELMLHAILRELFNTEPAVNKLFYKSASNDTVKGFDAVHVRKNSAGLIELWLGEVKFYSNIQKAIASVTTEIQDHLAAKKMREEFMCVGAHVDSDWEYASYVKQLLDRNTSLDDIFRVICIPVLLTYESAVVKNAQEVSERFLSELRIELKTIKGTFDEKNLCSSIKIQLILLPLKSKEVLVKTLDAKLKALQA